MWLYSVLLVGFGGASQVLYSNILQADNETESKYWVIGIGRVDMAAWSASSIYIYIT